MKSFTVSLSFLRKSLARLSLFGITIAGKNPSFRRRLSCIRLRIRVKLQCIGRPMAKLVCSAAESMSTSGGPGGAWIARVDVAVFDNHVRLASNVKRHHMQTSPANTNMKVHRMIDHTLYGVWPPCRLKWTRACFVQFQCRPPIVLTIG